MIPGFRDRAPRSHRRPGSRDVDHRAHAAAEPFESIHGRIDRSGIERDAIGDDRRDVDPALRGHLQQLGDLGAQVVGAPDELALADDEIFVGADRNGIVHEADGDHATQGTQRLHPDPHQFDGAEEVERDIDSALFLEAGSDVHGIGGNRHGTMGLSEGESVPVDVDGVHDTGAELTGQLHRRHAEAARPEDCDAFALDQSALAQRMEGGGGRAHHHGRLLCAHIVRDRVGVAGRDDHLLCVSAVAALAEHLSVRTELLVTPRAELTRPARRLIVQCDPLSQPARGHLRPASDDRARHFVTERDREKGSRRKAGPVVHVGPADARRLDRHDDVGGPGLESGPLLVHERRPGFDELNAAHVEQGRRHGGGGGLRESIPTMTIYLDHAATTTVRPEVREAMAPFLDDAYGNPSGLHAVSRRAKNALEEARERAAEFLGAARPFEIVFTGGGTEADNLAVAGSALAGETVGGVVTVATEHEAVLEAAHFVGRLGGRVAIVGVDGFGRVEPAEVAAAVDDTTTIASVMYANNETGVIQPVADVAAAVRARRSEVLMHSDAVQAFLTCDVTVAGTACDLLSLAAHKFGGPKGVGLLYVRNGVELEPVLHGGGQELGRRSGTQNVAGIVGMVAAMEVTVADRADAARRIGRLRDRFEEALRAGSLDIEVNAPVAARLPQHSHLRIVGVASETLLIRLDQAGVAAAAGSACQSGAIDVSHVLAAMGYGEEAAAECVRFSFGWSTTEAEVDKAAAIVVDTVRALT